MRFGERDIQQAGRMGVIVIITGLGDLAAVGGSRCTLRRGAQLGSGRPSLGRL
jgi:hypothetical protein